MPQPESEDKTNSGEAISQGSGDAGLQGVPTRDWARVLGMEPFEAPSHLNEEERALFEQAFNAKAFHERYHLLPYRDPRTTACQTEYWQTGAEGTVAPLTVCEETVGRHDYYDHDTATLEQLSQHDAVAAQVLGQRLIHTDPERSWDLHFRAAALSGKPGPLVDLIALRFTSTHTDSPDDIARIYKRVLVGQVAERLGYPIDISSSFMELLREHVFGSNLDARIDGEVDQLIAALNHQRAELIGTPSLDQ